MNLRESVGVQRAGVRHPWLLWLLAAALVAGTGICLYLTRFHENQLHGDASATLANCPESETTNCEVVNTSGYSELAGVPISALGIPTYLLLLALIAAAGRCPRVVAYVFAIGILTVLYSAYLYYVSEVRIGFLCLWCFRLYCINAGIPVLAGLAAWRSPVGLLRDAVSDLRRLAPEVRMAAALFVVLLASAVLGDRVYRAPQPPARPVEAPLPESARPPSVPPAGSASPAAAPPLPARRGAHAAPQAPPVPPPGPSAPPATGAPPQLPAPAMAPAVGGAFVVPGPLARVAGRAGGIEQKPFDLQSHIGRGRPVALLFWAPGYPLAESALVALSHYIKGQAPQLEMFAIAGRREDQRAEMLWESFLMLDLPADLPLLVDDGFAVSKQLDVTDVPNLVLIDGRGSLVISKIKGLEQIVTYTPTPMAAERLIRAGAQGATLPPITRVPPYYPASELFGQCAPEFTLSEVMSGRVVTFTGRSANGRPTLLMFWSSTCRHCQKEIPQLLAHVRSHPGQYNVVSVAMIKPDRPDGFSHRKVTEAYIRSNGIPWPVLDDSSGYATDLYKVVSTPTTFLISPGGQVMDAWYYPHESLDAPMAQALARLNAAAGACRPRQEGPATKVSFSVLGPDDRRVAVESLADRPALVHLWATWCVPCQTELPDIFKFKDALENMGGRLILVSVEDVSGSRSRATARRREGSRTG
ncbi:MAG: hypothetical protein AUH92_04350 [Acidobacteria bacterium 13_1_40CM_4_69_4]|nr:MAG: hypothetical protein AUH92_04350 [Acidobacteria bacterium 13_1_40CM_4_69_4]